MGTDVQKLEDETKCADTTKKNLNPKVKESVMQGSFLFTYTEQMVCTVVAPAGGWGGIIKMNLIALSNMAREFST